jgi:large subunit ribosomal protein L25
MSEKTMITIEGKHREVTGKGACRRMRRDGVIPAVLCHKGKTTMLEINPKFLARAWQNEKSFNLSLDGKVLPVRITELQLDHVKRTALHVDLAHI